MDIARPERAKKLKRRRLLLGAGAALLLGVISLGVSQLRPAAPAVDRSAVWMDTVKRGPMVRQVRGLGTLVPEDFQWIAARTEGRVEKIIVRPGKALKPTDVICVLSNPELQQEAADAELNARAGEAKLATLRSTLEQGILDRRAENAKLGADLRQAELQLQVNEQLSKNSLVSSLDLQVSLVKANDLKARFALDQQRLEYAQQSLQPQLAAQQADVDRLLAAAVLKKSQVDALQVRAGMIGVLQALPLEVGQRVTIGTNLARVADPTKLKAQIKIAETQAKDITVGQPSSVDTRNGLITGEVTRIDPAVQNGTVLVDVSLNGELPKGARPDLSVEGVIELERLDDVTFVGRPAYGQEKGKVGLFRVSADGREALRVSVELGRSSVNTIEVVQGLQPGDRVILSDMTQWDSHDRLRLN